MKQSGDKYGRLAEKQRYLDYLKQEWQKLDMAIGKEASSIVRESTEKMLEEKEKSNVIDFNDVTINEEWAINNHYKQMNDLQKSIIKLNVKIENEKDFIKKTNLQGKKSSLENELESLKKYSKSDIIMFAKSRKAAYLNAKKRYQNLSAMEKLKIKISGKELNWEKVKDDNSYTASDFDIMYQSRSR